jgi:hypothetical protein
VRLNHPRSSRCGDGSNTRRPAIPVSRTCMLPPAAVLVSRFDVPG